MNFQDLFTLKMNASNTYSDDNEDQDIGFRDGYQEGFIKALHLIKQACENKSIGVNLASHNGEEVEVIEVDKLLEDFKVFL